MNLHIKYFLITSLVISFLYNQEILFTDKFAMSFNIGMVSDSQVLSNGEEKKRKFVAINQGSISLLFLNKFQLKYQLFKKHNLYPTFDLPYAGLYTDISFLYYLKNKTSFDLNFDIGYKYFYDSRAIYNISTLIVGVSKMNTNNNFNNFTHIQLLYELPNYTDSRIKIKISYPISMDFVPKDNTPSSNSISLLPSLLLYDGDIRFALNFGMTHKFK